MPMNAELKEKWLKALRSGEYQQTRRRLFDGVGYCCLGVLCSITGDTFSPGARYFETQRGESTMPFMEKLNEFGLDKRCNAGAAYDAHAADTLAGMNDSGYSFAEIADFIEKYL